jgi:small subunit ribosomal protein S17
MPRRVVTGVVVSNKNDKTVLVRVESFRMHPLYKKYVRRHKKYAAHCENGGLGIGAEVKLEECRPISKTKRWVVISD